MSQPSTTVDVTTITSASNAVGALIALAVNGYFTYQLVEGRPTIERTNQIAVRLAGLTTEGDPCAKGMIARFEITVVLCIDDDPTKGVDTSNASGPEIAKTMWRVWAGLVHVCQQLQRRPKASTDMPRCDQIDFGDFSITYEQAMARGQGTISFPVATEPTAIGS